MALRDPGSGIHRPGDCKAEQGTPDTPCIARLVRSERQAVHRFRPECVERVNGCVNCCRLEAIQPIPTSQTASPMIVCAGCASTMTFGLFLKTCDTDPYDDTSNISSLKHRNNCNRPVAIFHGRRVSRVYDVDGTADTNRALSGISEPIEFRTSRPDVVPPMRPDSVK